MYVVVRLILDFRLNEQTHPPSNNKDAQYERIIARLT